MLTSDFISACKEFAKKRQGVLNEELEDTKKFCSYHIEFYNYALEFRYIKKKTLYYKPSSLYCVIRLRKNSVVYYHLTDIIPFLEHKTFKSCYFWNIENSQRLNSCFESLVATLDYVLSQLTPFLSDDHILLEALFDNYKTIYGMKESDINFCNIDVPGDYAQSHFLSLQNIRDGYIFSRYCDFAPYALLLKNKTAQALKKYEKLSQKNELLEYEKHLINYIINSENYAFCAFDAACDTSASKKLITPLTGLIHFAVVFAVFSVIFCGIFALYNFIISIDALVVLVTPWYTGFLCAGLCSVFGAIAFVSNKPIANRHLTKKERNEFSDILVSKGEKKLTFIVFVVSVAVSVIFAVMIMTANVRFYNEKITFENKTYYYSNIHSVYYIKSRYNVYGDKIDRGSYVLLFDDKTSLDLDGFTSIEFTEKEVVPLLREQGVDVKEANSEKELPWYTEE